MNGFGTDGSGLSVASANSQVFRVFLKCRVGLQSPRNVRDSAAGQSSEKKFRLLGRAANLVAEVLLMMGCYRALR